MFKHLLKNIAQGSLLRTILLFVLGGAMWALTLWNGYEMVATWVTMALTIINGTLLSYAIYKCGWTNLPSTFVFSSYWVILSSIPLTHNYWQGQLAVLVLLAIFCIFLKISYHDEATEESFLMTLLCCFLALWPVIAIAGVIAIWIVLIIQRHMTWRVWAASFIAIIVYALLIVSLQYFGKLDKGTLETIPQLSWQQWTLFGGIFVYSLITILLPIRKPSVSTGAIYSISVLGFLLFGVLIATKMIQIVV